MPLSPIPAQERWVSTPQGRLFTRCWSPGAGNPGRDVPIVLFHDSLGCIALWRDFPERLAQASGRTVIAYDRLGFGRSDPHPGRLDRDFVQDEARGAFAAVREQLRIERFIAFGHSVGGGMAVACAARHAPACIALVTESAQAFVEDRTIQGIGDARRSFQAPGQRDRLVKYHGDKTDWVLAAWIETWLAPDFAGWNLDADLRGVHCPVLALHGDHDAYGSVRHPRRIAEQVAGPATVVILPDCGHVPHREQPEAVRARVTAWLDGAVGRE